VGEGGLLADYRGGDRGIHAKLFADDALSSEIHLDRTFISKRYITTSCLRQATKPEQPRASKPRLGGTGVGMLTRAEVAFPSSASGPFVFPVIMGWLATVSYA
jgi:hypothetical protein